jgi:hypothetical protein
MAAPWVTVASLLTVFLVGAASAIDYRITIAVIVLIVIAGIIRIRLRPVNLRTLRPVEPIRPDWLVIAFPTAVALRALNEKAALVCVGLLVAAAFVRKSEGAFKSQLGPLACLFASAAIVFARPSRMIPVIMFLLAIVFVWRLVTTVDTRSIIASLIDGCGLYLVANVAALAVGLHSPAADIRIGGLAESTGFVRTIYPITTALNAPPAVAAVVVVSFGFLILEPGLLRRTLRTVCLIAAIIVLAGAGSRAPITVAALLSLTVLCFPSVLRYLAQVATIFAAISFAALTTIADKVYFAIAPLTSLAPGRVSDVESITSLEGREVIWRRSIEYWSEWVNGPRHILFGYGVNGQYGSGVSMGYKDLISGIVRNPELASLHNSYLQQIFDGGLIGWILLVSAIFWAGARFARQRAWGIWGLSASAALTALVLSGLTEVSLSPGPYQDTFWVLIILIGAACQSGGDRGTDGGRSDQSESDREDRRGDLQPHPIQP